ncbi:MAG: stalk domain-containing protein [archaeon]
MGNSSFTITASAGVNGTISPSGTITVNIGANQTFTIAPNTGYRIKDVKVDGTSVGVVSTYTFDNITSDHMIEAVFEQITHIISASSDTGGSISPSGTVTVNYGDSKTFTITPNSGYKISNVKVDSVSVGVVSSYTFTNVSSNHTIEAAFEKEITQTIISLKIGNKSFTVNGVSNALDSPPVIKNNRTLLPIRAIIEALGGTVDWEEKTKVVEIKLESNYLKLQIGNVNAYVNGVQKLIDPLNSKVVPEIINGRTMLPLRFVAENLGCDVQWDGTTKTITIEYTKEGE